jgi:The GLUG motif
MDRRDTPRPVIVLSILVLGLAGSAQAQYGGGTGTANNPFQIATAADLIALGETPEDYDQHFVLTADIDLDPSLPGRKVFDKAVIGDWNLSFIGVFDGNGHRIVNITISGIWYVGLFGRLGPDGQILNLGLEDVNIVGATGWVTDGIVSHLFRSKNVGGLVGHNDGSLTRCYITGIVQGEEGVGGLVGSNWGTVTDCYSTVSVSGSESSIGGLVGSNEDTISRCYSAGAVCGERSVGGLVGSNDDTVTSSFWDVQTSGQATSAGGVGKTTAELQTADTFLMWGTCGNDGTWTIDEGRDYPRLSWQDRPGEAIAIATTLAELLSGTGTEETPYLIHTADELRLIGLFPCDWDKHFALAADIDLAPNLPRGKVFDAAVIACDIGQSDWDFPGIPFSGVFDGDGHTISHLVIAGEDFLGLFGHLASEGEVKDIQMVDVSIAGSGDYVGGLVGRNSGIISRCYSSGVVSGAGNVGGLVGQSYGSITASESSGTVSGAFNIGGLAGQNYDSITGSDSSSAVSGNSGVGGLVGQSYGNVTASHSAGPVDGRGRIGGLIGSNSGVVSYCHSTSSISRTGDPSNAPARRGSGGAGGLVGENEYGGAVVHCHSSGMVEGDSYVGGLVGINADYACIAVSYSSSSVSGNWQTGGLVGNNSGSIVASYSTGAVDGNQSAVGGLVGNNDHGYITASYSRGPVMGNDSVGGFVGSSLSGSVVASYCTGAVTGNDHVGGFTGYDDPNTPSSVTSSFWNVETSRLANSTNGIGLTTAEMQDASTFLREGWDLVDEVLNGTCDYWQMAPGSYPELSYQVDAGPALPAGLGTVEEPYLIRDTRDLGAVWFEPLAHYRLDAPVDLSGITWSGAAIPWFGGTLDGDGQVISNLHIRGSGHLGLLGKLGFGAQVSSLGLEAVDVCGIGDYVGGLVGYSRGMIVRCYSTGTVEGNGYVGGLAGLAGYYNDSILESYSACTVTGDSSVGGLVGMNDGWITWTYSTGAVSGRESIGGLAGRAAAPIHESYSSGPVTGDENVGGLAGLGPSSSRMRGWYESSCFWDIQTSEQTVGGWGVGKTTTEMQMAATFLEAGWDFVGETENGTDDVWWIDEGQGYPRLWWEGEF